MDIVANAYILFIAGFETVSTSMSFCMYELALRKDVQDKVRKEILEVKSKHNGQMNSECLNELNYMGMVIKGMLNKWFFYLILHSRPRGIILRIIMN